MLAIEKIILPPPAEQLTLFGFLIILVLLLHIPFISMFLGSSLFSVTFNILDNKEPNRMYARFAHDVLETGIYQKTLGVLLGILPLVTLLVIFSQILFDSGLSIARFLTTVLVFVTIGLALMYVYHHTFAQRENQLFLHLGSGVAGLVFLLAAYFVFISTTTLITDFEKRAFIQSPDPYSLLFSWNVIARYLSFLMAALALTGGAVLFYYFRWSEEGPPADEEYRRFLRTFSAGLPLPCIALLPVLLLWDVITVPTVALSGLVFGLLVTAVVLLMLIFFLLLSIVRHDVRPQVVLDQSKLAYRDKSKLVSPVFLALLVTVALLSVKDQKAIENAIRDHSLVLAAQAAEAEKALAAKLEKAKGPKVAENAGETIFTTRCSLCHQYDRKLVGPPLNTVLPKYQTDPDALAAFIQNPTKKNPGFPPMPSLGLTHVEATAVATYVLRRLEEEGARR